jgi:hypothetical protein
MGNAGSIGVVPQRPDLPGRLFSPCGQPEVLADMKLQAVRTEDMARSAMLGYCRSPSTVLEAGKSCANRFWKAGWGGWVVAYLVTEARWVGSVGVRDGGTGMAEEPEKHIILGRDWRY